MSTVATQKEGLVACIGTLDRCWSGACLNLNAVGEAGKKLVEDTGKTTVNMDPENFGKRVEILSIIWANRKKFGYGLSHGVYWSDMDVQGLCHRNNLLRDLSHHLKTLSPDRQLCYLEMVPRLHRNY